MNPVTRATTGLGITQIIGWGSTYYAPTVLSGRMAADTGWSLTWCFAAFSWGAVVSGLSARRTGGLVDRIGARRMMSGGSVVMTLGLLLVAAAESLPTLFAAWTLLGLAMRAVLYEAAFTSLTVMAGPKSRSAISTLTLWGGFASTVFWPLGHWLGEACGWRLTFVIYAAMNLLVCLPLHWWVNRGPRDAGFVDPWPEAGHTGSAAMQNVAPIQGLSDAQRDRIVILLGSVLGAYTVIFATLSAHLVGFLEGLGLAAGLAVTVSSIKGIAQTGARFIELSVQKWLGPLTVGLLATAMLPISMLMFGLAAGHLVGIIAACIVYGAANGLVTIVRGAVPLALFGTQGYGAILGRIAAPGLVVAAVAPTASAWIMERFGTLVLLGVMMVFSIASFGGMVYIAQTARRAARAT